MALLADSGFDIASALALGSRDTQEDALASYCPIGSDLGLAVLADGMGGHAAGDIASQIVVTEVFADLQLRAPGFEADLTGLSPALRDAAETANACVGAHAASNPTTGGMGTTLIAVVARGEWLGWLSVGDSPLYLWRDGVLRQLNEDHSMAPQIDWLVKTGRMDAEVGRYHPDRNCLTSVLMGGPISRIDCPDSPFRLHPKDIILMASDGLQFLGDDGIAEILQSNAGACSDTIAAALLDAIRDLADQDQDNVSLMVLQPRESRATVSTKPVGAQRAAIRAKLTATATKTHTTFDNGVWSGVGQIARRLLRQDGNARADTRGRP